MRLLHSIISRILFPKMDRFDFILERFLIIMHCIIEEISINLPRMIFSYMCEAVSKSLASLLYGMVLILIFRRFNIEISYDEPKRSLKHTDNYNVRTLHRMGYKKINGHWRKKGGERRISEEGSNWPMEEDIPEMLTAPISDQPASSIPTRLSEKELRQIAGYLADKLATRVYSV